MMKYIYEIGIITALAIVSILFFRQNSFVTVCASDVCESPVLKPSASPLSNTMEPSVTLPPVTVPPTSSPSVTSPPENMVPTPTPMEIKTLYRIIYVLNNGTNHKDNPSIIPASDLPITLKNPKKSGYTFKGWYLNRSFTKVVKKIDYTQSTNITLYARWEKVTVKTVILSSVKYLNRTQIKVKIKHKEAVDGYEYVYSTNAAFSKKYRLCTTKNPKVLSRLKKEETYYLKVRAYKIDSTKKKIYGKYSRIKKIHSSDE